MSKKSEKNKMLSSLMLCCIAILCNVSILCAQSFVPYNEVGLIGGASYYLGDLNKSHFNSSQIGGGLVFRRNVDRRCGRFCIPKIITDGQKKTSHQENLPLFHTFLTPLFNLRFQASSSGFLTFYDILLLILLKLKQES